VPAAPDGSARGRSHDPAFRDHAAPRRRLGSARGGPVLRLRVGTRLCGIAPARGARRRAAYVRGAAMAACAAVPRARHAVVGKILAGDDRTLRLRRNESLSAGTLPVAGRLAGASRSPLLPHPLHLSCNQLSLRFAFPPRTRTYRDRVAARALPKALSRD